MLHKGCKDMKITNIFAIAGVAACVTAASGGTGFADSADTATKPGIERFQMLRVRLPHGLCEFDRPLPANLVDKLSTRRDFDRLLSYMLVNCPTLALPLADMATASIDIVDEDGDGRPDTPIITPPPGGEDNPGGGGNPIDDDDGNNGHGNDEDGYDDSNPGRS